jgi:DNA-binding transcriptional ArsR family regulator
MNLELLKSKAGAAEAMLKAVANRNRLIILCELLKGERSVGALQTAIGLSQSALSQHLARLREDELVATRRESQTIYYSLSSKPVTRLIALLYELYCEPHYDVEASPPKTRTKAK